MKTYLASLHTREAAAIAREARAAEKQHTGGCITCVRAVRKRSPAELCDEGRKLATAKREAEAQLAEERRLDKQPMPGQEALFEVPQ